jgi:hypothetical protein
MKHPVISLPFLLTIVVLPVPARAQNGDLSRPASLILTDKRGKYPLELHPELPEDPCGELTIDEVSSPEFYQYA